MRFSIVVYTILISMVGFICIPKGNDWFFPQPSKKITGKERINKAFQFPFHPIKTKEFVHFIKKLNDPRGIEWVRKRLEVGLKIHIQKNLMDFNDICWLWIKSEIKEFQEIIQNWINHNGEQIREYFSKKKVMTEVNAKYQPPFPNTRQL